MDGSDPHFDAESIATHNTSWDLEAPQDGSFGAILRIRRSPAYRPERRKLPFIGASSSCDMVCCLLFGGCEQAARLNGSGYRMTIAAPPIEPSKPPSPTSAPATSARASGRRRLDTQSRKLSPHPRTCRAGVTRLQSTDVGSDESFSPIGKNFSFEVSLKETCISPYVHRDRSGRLLRASRQALRLARYSPRSIS
jgi:hypothetical protein